MDASLVIIANDIAKPFAKEVAKIAEAHYIDLDLKNFPDGEMDPTVADNIRGADVFYMCPYYPHPMVRSTENRLVNNAVFYASAKRLTSVPMYLGFMRKDWKDRPRCAIAIRAEAVSLESSHVNHILTNDVHSPQIQGVFRIPSDILLSLPAIEPVVKQEGLYGEGTIVFSADIGGLGLAASYAEVLGSPLGCVYKLRTGPGESEAVDLMCGVDIKGKRVLLVDDLGDSCRTLAGAGNLVKERGAEEVYAAITHGVFSPKRDDDGEIVKRAEENLKESPIKMTYVTDTIPRPDEYIEANKEILTYVSMAPLYGEAISRIHTHRSVSAMFRKNI